jgi:hypothetical protein
MEITLLLGGVYITRRVELNLSKSLKVGWVERSVTHRNLNRNMVRYGALMR